MRRTHAAVASCALVAALAAPRGALADPTKAECVDADTNAQNQRRAEHFRAARALLELCSSPSCPKVVRDDCVQRQSDLDSVTPTIVFVAKDGGGEDLIAVRVTMDGAPFASELSGAALAIDPGPHTFRFERSDASGAAPIERKLVIREGEKARQERVTFGGSSAPPAVVVPAVTVSPAKTEPARAGSWSSQKTGAVVAGAAGVIGLIVGSVTGAMSFSAWSSSKSECGTGVCTNRLQALSDHDSAVTDATVSDVGFIAGGVLLATGVFLYLTAPSSQPSSTSAGVRVVPSLAPGAGGLSVSGRF